MDIEHVCSYADEGVCLNAIIKERFIIPRKWYEDTKSFAESYNGYLAKRNSLGTAKYKGQRILDEIGPHLIARKPAEITEADCCIYLIYRMVWLVVNDARLVRHVMPDAYEELETAFLQSKRTGIVASVFLNDLQVFQNAKRFKNDRVYVSFKTQISGKGSNLIFLIATDGQSLGADQDIEKIADAVTEKFTNNATKLVDKDAAIGA